MRRPLAALLVCMASVSSARAELGIPVSEEVYNMIAYGGGIFLVISFAVLFFIDRRNARANPEIRRPPQKSEAQRKIDEAQARLVEELKKHGR